MNFLLESSAAAIAEGVETMDRVTRLYVRVVEGKLIRRCARLTNGRGQTMTEYALVLAGVAVVVYSGYKSLGSAIKSSLTKVDGQL